MPVRKKELKGKERKGEYFVGEPGTSFNPSTDVRNVFELWTLIFKRTKKEEFNMDVQIENKVKKLKETGISIRKIAEELDISKGSVQNVLKKCTKMSVLMKVY
jgi:predicted DNA binding protein